MNIYNIVRRMVMNKAKLTSVKILKSLYDNFKLQTVNTKMTLQKINRIRLRSDLPPPGGQNTVITS